LINNLLQNRYNKNERLILNLEGGKIMGRDRQEKKLRNSNRVESDRDKALHYNGSTRLQSPEDGRLLNDNKQSD